jgi:tripartite-type tricarboxylate transporter receptor subunit TctC
VRRALHQPEVLERLHPEGIEPGDLDPRRFTEFVEAELQHWGAVVRSAGARVD